MNDTTAGPTTGSTTGPATQDEWWRNALVYQVYVRSFADSDGDGVGDLPGIRSRLDHLAALGIDAIWLNPCYPSPQRDHGYDVADYVDIHDEYGTLDDFDELLSAARERGIKIMMDLVPTPLLERARVVPLRAERTSRQPRARTLLLPRRSTEPTPIRTARRRTPGRPRSATRRGPARPATIRSGTSARSARTNPTSTTATATS